MRAKAIVTLGLVGLITLSAIVIAGALTLPTPGTTRTISVSKVLMIRGFTVDVTGMLVVNSTAQTLSGTLTAIVTNSTGGVIATVTKTKDVAAGTSVAITETMSLPMLDSTLMVDVDVTQGTAQVTYVNNHHGTRG